MKVAIKVIKKTKIDGCFKANNEVFEELNVLKDITQAGCTNTLELIEHFQDQTQEYIVTKHMEGGDLFNFLVKQPNQPLFEDEALAIIRQIANGVASLHSRNIIHRDIKIDNILVDSSEEQKRSESNFVIGDFGTAAKLRSKTDTSNFRVGTPGYVAPEVILG